MSNNPTTQLKTESGRPMPLGVQADSEGYNFSVFSQHATRVTLCLYHPGVYAPFAELELDPLRNRTGSLWHIRVCGPPPDTRYTYRMDMQPNPDREVFRYQADVHLLDPRATAISGAAEWAVPHHRVGAPSTRSPHIRARRGLLPDITFDWGEDQPPNTPLSETVIYELNVRGYTRHPTAGVQHPGTFEALIEKIPYLKQLGVTAVELLPIFEYEENLIKPEPSDALGRRNLWGYAPLNYFAPKASFSAQGPSDRQVHAFKTMVKAFHQAGLEVILDVVFNHTGEGRVSEPTFSFRGIDNAVYYMINHETGRYRNFTGCGNTFNVNHPVVSDLIIDALRYWVTEMHVDGFRFDLAAILNRGVTGRALKHSPLLDRISADPILAKTKLIAEPWDAAGLYQAGAFAKDPRWSEWNGPFRDDVRRFIKGDPGMTANLIQRLLGSPDLYEGREPTASINFITCHDGFTLADLVTYQQKRNQANGEKNQDGSNQNFNWNHGVEGPSDDPEINRLRRRQMKNMAVLLMLAAGVPMLNAGDEFGRTQNGNNNAYCQDNEVGWVDWSLAETNADLTAFFRGLIALRRRFPLSGSTHPKPKTSWDIPTTDHRLNLFTSGPTGRFYLAINAHWEAHEIHLPAMDHERWHRVLDTWLEPPHDLLSEDGEELLLNPNAYMIRPRSIVLLHAK